MSKLQFIVDFIRRKPARGNDNTENGNVIINCPKTCTVTIFGQNNHIEFIGERKFFGGHIQIGTPDCNSSNVKIVIGKGTCAGKLNIMALEDFSEVEIGNDCLFSKGDLLWCTDSHCVLSEDGELINRGRKVIIGNHVWVGLDVKIGKNALISDNSVVGWGSVVTKKFTEPNVVIAGNPAKICKKDINWSELRPNEYIKKGY